jgi:hypothetical protein
MTGAILSPERTCPLKVMCWAGNRLFAAAKYDASYALFQSGSERFFRQIQVIVGFDLKADNAFSDRTRREPAAVGA